MSEAYRAAGVDLEAGYETVERIGSHVKRTKRPEVLGGIGGFGGLFALGNYQQPVLVSGTDGVGTKLKLAFDLDQHDTIGIDCVAMCVNDIVVSGAEPLFFLDYLATGKLQPAQAEAIVKGIADGCVEAGCALVGGETAEMPGMYARGEYDVAGFAVGAVERAEILDGPNSIMEGDLLIGVASSGIHSNGFSLVRKIVADANLSLQEKIPSYGKSLGEVLLTPTKIYVRPFRELLNRGRKVRGAAHITGGGFYENIPRMLPEGLCAEIDLASWEVPAIFKLLQEAGKLTQEDLYRTFNMGIGLVIAIPTEERDKVLASLRESGEEAYVIGVVKSAPEAVRLVGEPR
ncbi:phosphoribosylformylglycinamidine cyclo-ligase [Risungbinella massiliensis]|uniref:phosphoribosylformylglycinamidine cyclo-ligase n=1 Tax=Risungbinella massiliensis TaxID=1329796 RepID=UPI0005CC63CA|nr:phosphoribosylformylglycinamidine cyclo-ligase [Risungbinella massiliensis]